MPVPKDVKKAIGKRLKDALDAREVTGYQLGRAVGHSDGTQVSKWCTGDTGPSAESLVQIAKMLDISGHWLLTGEGTMDDAVRGGGSEKLIAAKWMEITAEELRREARRPDDGEVARRVRKAIEARTGSEAAPEKEPDEGTNGGA